MLLLAVTVAPMRSEEGAPAAPPPAPAYRPPEDPRELLRVDDEMRAYFDARVDRKMPDVARLRAIVQAVVGPAGLNFAYESQGAYDAREAFRRRRGNCQAFAFLVVAVARDYRLQARFQDLETLQHWNRYGRFVATERHSNVQVETLDESYVVDFRPDLGRPTMTDSGFVVTDERAIALFYSTSGFFRLVAEDRPGAVRLMELATKVDPRCATVWSNFGSLQSQQGDLPAARACFERALALHSRDDTALTGIVDVLRKIGGPAELAQMAKYERRAQACRDRNPYYAYHLAGLAGDAGDWLAAEKHLRRAIRLKGNETLFHEQLVQVLRRQGREDDAVRAEAKLARLRRTLDASAIPLMP